MTLFNHKIAEYVGQVFTITDEMDEVRKLMNQHRRDHDFKVAGWMGQILGELEVLAADGFTKARINANHKIEGVE
jgi:hypothetical protein